MITTLSDQTRKARKKHRCIDCGGTISPGETYRVAPYKYDDDVYQWKQHLDCQRAGDEMFRILGDDYYDGRPPLCEEEEFMDRLDFWRGQFPHVVCRIEYRQQVKR